MLIHFPKGFPGSNPGRGVKIVQSLEGAKTGVIFDNTGGRTSFLNIDYRHHALIYPARRNDETREFCGGILGVLMPYLETVFPLNSEETMKKVYDALKSRFVKNLPITKSFEYYTKQMSYNYRIKYFFNLFNL